jgi:hypothetical protein
MTLVVQAGYFAKNNFLEVMERNIQALLSHPHISNFKVTTPAKASELIEST